MEVRIRPADALRAASDKPIPTTIPPRRVNRVLPDRRVHLQECTVPRLPYLTARRGQSTTTAIRRRRACPVPVRAAANQDTLLRRGKRRVFRVRHATEIVRLQGVTVAAH